MRFIKIPIFLFVVLSLIGCVSTTPKKESWVLKSNENNPAPCCDVIIDRLVLEYPPAQTTLHLSKSENLDFDKLLESKARKAGYKISQRRESVKISYVIDMMDEHIGYIHLKSSKGLVFNQMFRLPNYLLYGNYTQQISEVEK